MTDVGITTSGAVAKVTDAQAKAMLAAFRFIDKEAAIINGIPNEPSGLSADDPDEIASELAEVFGIPFDERWPENLAAHLTSQGATAGVPELNEHMFGQGSNR